ncbi:MAG TPA: hypothetical protein PLW14_07650 [Chlorobiota bacterium]|nr:hypothetical protein [Chlorobiota bacterium]
MFEKELERTRKNLRTVLATSQPYLPLRSILENENVGAAYRVYFRSEVDWWVHEERAIRMSNPRFDTTDPAFRTTLSQLEELYVGFARFDHEELHATIDAAVKTRLNYLCRPRTTLKWFVFRGEPTKPVHEVVLRLRYFNDYRYLIDGFLAWARSRGTSASAYEILSVVEFERIIEKVDNDAILDLSQEQFVDLLEPLYRFFADADPDLPPATVPTEAVIIFLDDKGAIPISQALERALYREELRYLTRSRLIDIINDVIAQIESQGLTPAEAVHEATRGGLNGGETGGVDGGETGGVDGGEADGEEDGVDGGEADGVDGGEADGEEDGVDGKSHEELQSDVLQKRMMRLGEHIDEQQRDRIIKKVFAKNEAAYQTTVQSTLSALTWKEAAVILDRRFIEYGVEPNGAVAMEFAQALHRTFLA